MATEIERKFLVRGEGWRDAEPVLYRQGYLNRDKYRVVRVRVVGEKGYLTVKGVSVGIARKEYEYEVPKDDAEEMLEMADGPLIEKRRRAIEHEGLAWEVDEFLGANLGLVVAEVEVPSEDHPVTYPPWIGDEVSADPRYFNANLVESPYTTWGP